MKFLMKQVSSSEFSTKDITVRVSSTLRRCFNSESFSLYEVSQIIALIFKKDEITRNYNKHLFHLLTRITYMKRNNWMYY
ncbi:unnamed protein product [Schistosoma rodhaini]|nr:unnamed protein product [Schistosoma rodhaini]